MNDFTDLSELLPRAPVLPTLSSLKTLGTRPAIVLVQGKTAANDGWGGAFIWAQGDTTTADDALAVQCLSGTAGRYKRFYSSVASVKFFGAVGISGTDDGPAFTAADTANDGYVPAGIWYIASNLTLTSDWVFARGAQINVASGKTVTFSGNVTGHPTTRHFLNAVSGQGSVVLSGQREKVHGEWWGAKADNSTASSAAFQAAHDALTNGGVVQLLNGYYSLTAAITISRTVHFWGSGRGINPNAGGTTFAVGTTFAHSGGVLFNFTTGSLCWRDFQILAATTDPTQNYTAIKFSSGTGKMDFQNIEVLGAGVCWDIVAGNVGEFRNCSSYYFSTAGMRFGGTASVYSGPWRICGGVVNNPNTVGVTNALTAAGNAVIHMDNSAGGVITGMGFAAINVPAGTTVLGATATTVTLSAVTTGAGVANGATVRYGYNLAATCLHFKANAFDISFTDMEIAGGNALMVVEFSPTGAGLLRPNTIWFNNLNATASTYFGVYMTGGVNIRFTHSWLGDVPFGDMVLANASTSVAADLEGLHFVETMIGSAGFHAAYFDYAKDIRITESYVVAASMSAAATYNAVHCTANARGQFHFSGVAGNDEIDSVVSVTSGYGLFLAAGSFAGVGDSVEVRGKLSGSTAAYADGSTPAGTLKRFEPVY